MIMYVHNSRSVADNVMVVPGYAGSQNNHGRENHGYSNFDRQIPTLTSIQGRCILIL